MLREHNFAISKLRIFFFHAISSVICFADYSHVQTVSRLRSALLNVPSTPNSDIVCVVFRNFIVVIFYRNLVQ